MKKAWIDGLEKDMVDEVTTNYKKSYYTRKRLQEILERRLKALSSHETNKDLYNSPNWSFIQADIIGQKRIYKEIISLISE